MPITFSGGIVFDGGFEIQGAYPPSNTVAPTVTGTPTVGQTLSSTTGSPTIIVSGGYRVYKFTSSGSITF